MASSGIATLPVLFAAVDCFMPMFGLIDKLEQPD